MITERYDLPHVDETGNTLADYLEAVSMVIIGVHVHDSRPGSYCVRFRYAAGFPGASLHAMHDGHSPNKWTVYNARSGWDPLSVWCHTPYDVQNAALDLTDAGIRRRMHAERRATDLAGPDRW